MASPLDPRLLQAFDPRRIAVVGATEDPNKVGGRPLHYLRSFGFQGAVYPINPKRETVQGLPAYPSLADLPETPDVAIVAVGQDAVPGVIDQCAERGIHAAIVMSSGFGETGAQGVEHQRALVAQARRLGVRLVGPNAQGVANFRSGAVMNFSTMFMEVAPQDGVARDGSLRGVEGLGADLPHMIDPHQRAGLAPLGLAQRAWQGLGRRRRPGRMRFGEQGAQCRVCHCQYGVERSGHLAI